MKKPQPYLLALTAALGSHITPLLAQSTPVVVQAESGTSTAPTSSGASAGDWAFLTAAATGTSAAVTYATSLTDVGGFTLPTSPGGGVGASAPATANRVLTYTVTFPAAGTYDLYARMRVGAGGANDDSYFYASGFGAKSPVTGTDWINANGLFNVGYEAGNSLPVDGGGGSGTGVWKWLNMSKYAGYGVSGVTFTVAAGALTQTFQVGAREDGLDFDKFAFGQTGLYYTVANLDNGTAGSTTVPVTFTPTGPPLATGKPKYLGCAYSDAQAPNFGAYWNAVTPENGGKWGSVQPTNSTTFNWTELDKAYNQAKPATGTQYLFRMHNLIWGAQQPTWVKNLSSADQLLAIKAWYAAVAARYPNIDHIDVVNEPINTPPTGFVTVGSPTTPVGSPAADGGGYINALGGTGTTGYDWIITSYQLARQYFPNAKLMINEYSVENSSSRAATYATIINLLKIRGLIDGIGIQGHAFSTAGQTAATINGNLATLAATGVPLYITEYDSDGPGDAAQLAEYQRVFPLFWENPNVKGVTLWGYRVGHWRTAQGANLVNADATERPAMLWLRNYIQTTSLGAKAASAASAGIFAYPNPASGSVSLSLPADLSQQAIEVQLINSLGQPVLRQTLPASAGSVRTLALPGVATGLYTLRLQSAAGVSSQKLFVE
ncbi:MAG: endo-1,4-beta-xylanase [Janthinobacterium lividum]